jgi:hypothetical protein
MIAGFITQGVIYVLQGLSNRAPAIRKSSNYGTTWGLVQSDTPFERAYDFDTNYRATVAESTIIYRLASLGEVYKSTNEGLESLVLSSGVPTSTNAEGKAVINIATLDVSDVMVAGIPQSTGSQSIPFYRTTDGGSNWTLVATYTATGHTINIVKIGRWPFDANKVYFLTHISGGDGSYVSSILYSVDGGVTWQNKNGNWTSVFGSAFTYPVDMIPLWV